MNRIIFSKDNIVKIDKSKFFHLKQEAFRSQQRKARIRLHKNICAPLHEMIIVHCKDTYIRPHKHIKKMESIHIIEGELLLVIFDNIGRVRDKIVLDQSKETDVFLCRLEKNIWHTLISLSDFVVFHETTLGPYTGSTDSIFASWAPEQKDALGVKEFIKSLLG